MGLICTKRKKEVLVNYVPVENEERVRERLALEIYAKENWKKAQLHRASFEYILENLETRWGIPYFRRFKKILENEEGVDVPFVRKQVSDVVACYNRHKWKGCQNMEIGYHDPYNTTPLEIKAAIDRFASNWPRPKELSIILSFTEDGARKKVIENISMKIARNFAGLEKLNLVLNYEVELEDTQNIDILIKEICKNQRQLKKLCIKINDGYSEKLRKEIFGLCIKLISKNLKELRSLTLQGIHLGEKLETFYAKKIIEQLKKNLPNLMKIRIDRYQQCY